MMKVKFCRLSVIGKVVMVFWYVFGLEYLVIDCLVRIRGYYIKGGVVWSIKLMGYMVCCLGLGKVNSGWIDEMIN